MAARGAPPPPQAREGGRENARGARRDGRHPKRRPRASKERAESPRRAESRRAACVARPRARGAPLARLAADAAPARGRGGGSLHRAERKEGRTTDENRTICTPSRAARLLGCGGESRLTVRFETRSRARIRAGARPAVRIARFAWEGFVQVLGKGLAGSRVVAREIERVRESPCEWITRRDERTHLESFRAAISSAAARPSGPRLIDQISFSRRSASIRAKFGASILTPIRGSRWCHSETRAGSVRPDRSRSKVMVKTPPSFPSSRLTHDARCDVNGNMNDTHEKKLFFSTPFPTWNSHRICGIHRKYVEFTENAWNSPSSVEFT